MQNDKLRTFFARWLELAEKKKSLLMSDKCKIILIIDGVDYFETDKDHLHGSPRNKKSKKEEGASEEDIPDWFPECFTPNFRVITTCNPNSKSLKYF